ncbi:MAG: GDP-mannose 4,6-dehydratase [Chloroflexota bacterium]
MEARNVLVTGGAGFIGSNLTHHLLNQGCSVTIFDSLRRPGSECNLRWLRETHGPRLALIQADVRDGQALRYAVRGMDRVYHLASQVAVTTSLTNPREDFDVNALGTLNVLEAVRLAGDDPIVFFTSTNKVYGRMDDVATVEGAHRYAYSAAPHGIAEDRPLDFYSPYGCSKGAGDQYVRDYARIYGLRTVVFRMSCIYGPHQFGNEDQGWVAHFTFAALQGQPITIYGNGKQVRDILFVDDLIAAFDGAARAVERTRGQIYNIGGGPANSLSLLQVIAGLEEIRGHRIPLTFADWRPGDQPIYVSDTRRAERDFGWRPHTTPATGLSRLLEWARAQTDLPQAIMAGR